jgi:hypothetical protein
MIDQTTPDEGSTARWLDQKRAEESAIAKVQDAALEAVRIACDKERKAISNPKTETAS